MKKTITIKDIAHELGVHHTTVSLALRNSKSIRDETRKKVWDKAAEMGYRPNRLAQGFRNRRSNTIGVLVPNIQHHFFAKFISEMSEKANQSGYSVMVFQSNEKEATEKRNVEALIDNRVAGVMASVSKETTTGAHFDAFKQEDIPLVFFDRVPAQEAVSKVVVDNYQGAYEAVKLINSMPKKRIAFITGSIKLNVYQERLDGYKQALLDVGLEFQEELLVRGDFFMKDGMEGAKKLMALPQKPDAILAVGDDVGIGAIKYLKGAGFRVPEDVAVVGFDNDPMGVAIDPELTTVSQPIELMADVSWQMLLAKIDASETRVEEQILPTSILRRQSC
ncbi:LacI family DNA-binding transcriptional regulator [Sunxiuqinia rutila]|uniref:LacI family DNA-binding transcriptional regulator n=1 Tax=Sunxiuqinia rutila TaxID=1397841 RepID=UPI003D363DDF